MKIFNENEKWSEKVNFVDENNVLVGYDLAQDCCENADYFMQREPQLDGYIKDGDTYTEDFLADFSFDTEYFEEVSSNDLEDGGMVIFKLDNEDEESIYLHLFNTCIFVFLFYLI